VESLDERATAARLYNRCWELLETEPRTSDEDAELLTCAFASRHHWLIAGGPEQWTTSDWMVSRAAGAIGVHGLALWFADRANDAARAEGTADWLVASTAEGLARAHFQAGHSDQGARWEAQASRLVAVIVDEEERALIAGQLASVRAV
jgi:hypothetical protein